MAPPQLHASGSDNCSKMPTQYSAKATYTNATAVYKPYRQFAPLLVIFVGLPARGKSLLARRLARYFNICSEQAKVFDVTEYRRKLLFPYASHEMFRADNIEALRVRQQSVRDAMNDAAQWLRDGHSIAILDGPNVTKAQRQEVYDLIVEQLNFRVMFIECVCENKEMLERNVKDILIHSPDYRDMGTEKACTDLRLKLTHYKAQYESLEHGGYCEVPCATATLIDGGCGGVVAHGVKGIKEAAVLSYITIPKITNQQVLYFSRHGESEYNVLGRIGGDANLSPRGKKYAIALARHVNALGLRGLQVWTSRLRRTQATAAGVNAPKQIIPELNEIDAGICEGLTYEELQDQYPIEFCERDKNKLDYRYPRGESYVDVLKRLQPMLQVLESETNVLIVSHQAVLRCVLGYFLDVPHEKIPYVKVPLHTIIKLTLEGHSYRMETIKMPIDCVDTTREKPLNCSPTRTAAEALQTVPAHFETLSI